MHQSRPSVSEAVSERGEIDGAPSPDDALHRRENHGVGQTSGATSFETRAAPAPQDEGMKPCYDAVGLRAAAGRTCDHR
jgi:hypothetical protein